MLAGISVMHMYSIVQREMSLKATHCKWIRANEERITQLLLSSPQ